jgi:3-oxoacyl-[acyl-carrier protein] reductase
MVRKTPRRRPASTPWGGRVAIVVGGSRGIGAATCRGFGALGISVTVAARSEAAAAAVARDVTTAGGDGMAVAADVADPHQVRQLVQRTSDAFGRCDFLVNCSADIESVGRPAWCIEPDTWQRCVDVNLSAVFHLVHRALPLMLDQRFGRILHLSSPFADLMVPRTGAYAATRAGVNQFIRVLAVDLADSGVTANVVYPGLVDTEGRRRFRDRLRQAGRPRHGSRGVALAPAVPASALLGLCHPGSLWPTGDDVDLSRRETWVRLRRLTRPTSGSEAAVERSSTRR